MTLFYRPPGAPRYLTKPMLPSGGRYVATLNSTADSLKTAGQLSYFVVAKDKNASPKTTRTPTSGALAMTVKVCKNTGPKFTPLTATPTSIITDPLGAGCSGSTLTSFQARATDVDGVKSIRLYFRKPGASSYSSRAFSKDGTTWYNYINTVSSVDNIARSGTISWYAVATDGKGATTKSPVKTINVKRCDSEATSTLRRLSDHPDLIRSTAPDAGHAPSPSASTRRMRTIPHRKPSRSPSTGRSIRSRRYSGAKTGGSMAGSQQRPRRCLLHACTAALTGQTFYAAMPPSTS